MNVTLVYRTHCIWECGTM